MIFGAHMSTGGGIWKALERAASVQGEIVQIFVKNNMQWRGRPYTLEEISRFKEHPARAGLRLVFGHTGYLINVGAPPSPNLTKSIDSLIQEIQIAASLGIPFLVMHPGAHLGSGEEEGLKQVIRSLDEVFAQTTGLPVKIALENTAGQGSCLGHQIRHLAAIFSGVRRPERLAVCLDTAHFFEAGYDLRTEPGWNSAIGEVERMIGLKQIAAFHINDSKTALGSRVDRHAGIGEGLIGAEAFRPIVNDPRFKNHAACLETPKSEDLHEDVQNLAILRALAAGLPLPTASATAPAKTSRSRSSSGQEEKPRVARPKTKLKP